PGLLRGQLGGGAVLVRGADVQDVVAALAEVPGVHVRREHGPHHVAQVLDPVDVRKGAGDEVSSHRGCSQVAAFSAVSNLEIVADRGGPPASRFAGWEGAAGG